LKNLDREFFNEYCNQQLKAFQDYYPDELAHCYGCGSNNPDGHQLKSYWDGDETIAHFTPQPFHLAIPGFVYGGLLASLIDCHGTGTAAAATFRAQGRAMDSEPAVRYVTASLKVDYMAPTPVGIELEIRGMVRELGVRKVLVDTTVSAEGVITARGSVVAVRMPEHMLLTQNR
jgi:acyl-coenzyme A thioesterase PaaI-like protein